MIINALFLVYWGVGELAYRLIITVVARMDLSSTYFWILSISLEKESLNGNGLASSTGPKHCGSLMETTCW